MKLTQDKLKRRFYFKSNLFRHLSLVKLNKATFDAICILSSFTVNTVMVTYIYSSLLYTVIVCWPLYSSSKYVFIYAGTGNV